jgi:hypothetical protein
VVHGKHIFEHKKHLKVGGKRHNAESNVDLGCCPFFPSRTKLLMVCITQFKHKNNPAPLLFEKQKKCRFQQ